MNIKELPEALLKRFLYLSTEEARFVSGNPETHGYFKKENLSSVSELLKASENDLTVLRNIFEVANNEKLLVRRATIFFALAVCVTADNINDFIRHELYTLVLNLCRNDEDFFSFIKFCSKIRKSFPSGLNKIIASYYFKKEPMELARHISATNSRHGWTHKDVIKLAHCKTDSVPMEAILTYILYGIKKAKAVASDNEEANSVIEYICKVKEFRCCNDEKKVVQLLPEVRFSHLSQIPSSLNKSQMVWEALLPQLPLSELINCLPKLYKLGFLKPTTTITAKVVEILSDNEKVKTSKIHPAEMFIGMRNLEKGGKPKDPKLIKYLVNKEEASGKAAHPDYKKPDFSHQEPAKCPAVIGALHKALTASYNNLLPTGKRIMVTVDAGTRMNDPCLTTRNVTCLEAGALIALSLVKAEKNVVLAVFNGTSVTPVSLEKSASLNQAIKKLREAKSDSVCWNSVFDWAASKNKQIDVFINVSTVPGISEPRENNEVKEKPKESLHTYTKNLKFPNARLISCCLMIHNLAWADGSPNYLDICGFDKNTPKVIEAFIRGLF